MNNIFYQTAAILLALLVLSTLSDHKHTTAAGLKRNHTIAVIVRSSPNAAYESRNTIIMPTMELAFRKARQEEPVFTPSLTDIYAAVSQHGKEKLFRLEQSGNFWDEEQGKRFVLPGRLSNKLMHEAAKLRTRHYGELIPWEMADPNVYVKSVFSIQDLETGLTFRVQRRAGRDHADVQPLTKQDTKIMKQIYEGSWSWKRKAIVVFANGRRLAASMNGMPHGGDGIPDNGFSGHFCVHFLGSTTHRSDVPDLAHQLMVHKAAGNIRDFVNAGSPLMLAHSWVEAMNHRDSEMVRLLTEGMDMEQSEAVMRELDSLSSIRTVKRWELDQQDKLDGETDAAVPLEVEIHQEGRTKQNTVVQFILKRHTPQSPWRIRHVTSAKGEQHGQSAS